MSFQQIILVGNLGNDPEMRYTSSGVPVTSFSLAVNRVWTGQDGQRQEKTVWFRVTAWRKQAELASQYLTKGRQVLIVGEMDEARVYNDREGNPRSSLEVTAFNIQFVGPRGDNGPSGSPASGRSPQQQEGGSAFNDEEIPF